MTNATTNTIKVDGDKAEAIRRANELRAEGKNVRVMRSETWIATCGGPASRAGARKIVTYLLEVK
jgi:hypothetical protein